MCCGTFDVVMFDVVKSLARRRSRVRVTVCRRTSLLYMMRVYESELACCECGVLGLHLRECLKNMKGSFVYSVQAHPHRTARGYVGFEHVVALFVFEARHFFTRVRFTLYSHVFTSPLRYSPCRHRTLRLGREVSTSRLGPHASSISRAL